MVFLENVEESMSTFTSFFCLIQGEISLIPKHDTIISFRAIFGELRKMAREICAVMRETIIRRFSKKRDLT